MDTFADPERLTAALQRLASVQPDATRLWGRMSVGGMLCHLNDAYEGVMSLRWTAPTGGKAPLAGRYLLRPFALHVPVRWPHGVPTPPEVDQLVGGTPQAEFLEDKERVVRSIQQFATADMGGTAHPYFGPLTQWEWMRWGWLHADHHLRQFSA